MSRTRNTLSAAQRGMLSTLARWGSCGSIMELVRAEFRGRGHAASYARFHRLRRRGLVAFANGRIVVTAAGEAVL